MSSSAIVEATLVVTAFCYFCYSDVKVVKITYYSDINVYPKPDDEITEYKSLHKPI